MSIIMGMITFCLGSARQKREYFKKMKDAVVLDNTEVLFCVSENGRNYFAIGKVPFSSFTTEAYLKYRRALCGGEPPIVELSRFGISPRKRIGRLSPAQMRCVTFLEKTCGKTEKTVVINLDGAKYTRKNAKALNRLLSACPSAYVSVTDRRFLRGRPKYSQMLTFGKPVKNVRSAFYTAKLLAEKLNAKLVAKF
ncbi:MAG: hypothetical protein J1G01_02945 [Clostridiales bacterium]|nr:hypothetical protein [Clostridiales bacterium]